MSWFWQKKNKDDTITNTKSSVALTDISPVGISINGGISAELTMLASVIGDGVILVDKSGRIVFMNTAMEQITGYSIAESVGFLFLDVMDLGDFKESLRLAISNGQNWHREINFVSKNGRNILAEASLWNMGNLFCLILKIKTKSDEAREFVSTASHEMRTPITTIEGYLGLALNPKTATIDERARKYLEAAAWSSRHLGQLFKDLLDTTKLEDGEMNPKMRGIELVAMVRKIAQSMENILSEKNIRLVLDKEALGQLVYVAADEVWLVEILQNLIDNARKWTNNGGTVGVSVVGEERVAVINVIDNGMGIRREDLPHIFQKFYRADTSHTQTVGGTGLGLYLVKKRVEGMGGKIIAQSELGKGTVFKIMLPRINAADYEKLKLAENNNLR